MLLPDTGDECREPNIACEQSVAHLFQIYAAKHQLKHGGVRTFRWVENEECLLGGAAATCQRERVGAKEHDSASRGVIVSRQRHHLHLATEANTRDTTVQRSPMASKGSCHCCTSKLQMQQNIENHTTLKSKIGVESSMLHNRNTFNKDKIRPAAKEKSPQTRWTGDGTPLDWKIRN